MLFRKVMNFTQLRKRNSNRCNMTDSMKLLSNLLKQFSENVITYEELWDEINITFIGSMTHTADDFTGVGI